MNNQWIVFHDEEQNRLNSLNYLNYLLQQSKKAIKDFNKARMIAIKWDLEEIKEETSLFYTLHKLQIDSEINTLRRLLKYELRQNPTD